MDPVAQEKFHRALLMTFARGHTQRASTETRARGPHGDPACADNLLTQWGYGCYSSHETQKLAHLARKADATGGYIQDLAALGSHGEKTQGHVNGAHGPHPQSLGACHHSNIRGARAYVRGKSRVGKARTRTYLCWIASPTCVVLVPAQILSSRILHAVRRLRKRQRRRKTQEVLGVISPRRPSPTAVF